MRVDCFELKSSGVFLMKLTRSFCVTTQQSLLSSLSDELGWASVRA